MRISKLAEMTEDELHREVATLQEQIFRIRFRIGTGNIENPSKLGQTRKDLARVKTLLREHELKLQVSHSPKGSRHQAGAENQGEAK